MSSWDIKIDKDFSCKDALFIEGLPGIGNVGKIAVDYLVEKLDAKKIGTLFSYELPNSVFVNEDNLVQLPLIELFATTYNGKDIVFLTGDTQPSSEVASYELSQQIIELLVSWNVSHIVTTGGIGLDQGVEDPEIYSTGNDKEFVKTFYEFGAKEEIYGVVGPIVGVSGLLLGLAKSIPAATVLVETFAHPMYVGLKEARELVSLLSKRFDLGIDMTDLDEEIQEVEDERDEEKKTKYAKPATYAKDVNYIG